MALLRLDVGFSCLATFFFAIFGSRYPAYATAVPQCSEEPTVLHLPDPPYDNYIYFDCHSSSHVVITSPLPASSRHVISPRLLIAWPAGNSGIVTFFEPEDGELGIRFENSTTSGNILDGIYETDHPENPNPRVGVTGWINFNSSAILTVPILGSIRTIRDYTEGGGALHPEVQNAIVVQGNPNRGATVWRKWFDDTTSTWITFHPPEGEAIGQVTHEDGRAMLRFPPGTYQFDASSNYPQLEQLSPSEALKPQFASLARDNPDQTTSLSFLSYKDKLLAGTWRFLTYFGRDSMISLLLMQPILSEGQGGAIEAVIGAVLERLNRSDGTVCHEESIGDFATFFNRQNGKDSPAPSCDYKMIDTDYFLPIAMKNYFVDTDAGKEAADGFMKTEASFLEDNKGHTYGELSQVTAEKIMRTSAPFVLNQVKDNLIHLREGESVGEWRDSNTGLGGGRIPYDVNTALVPAGLRAIATLSRAGFFPDHPDWSETADQYAEVWEDSTLHFFEVKVPLAEARSLVESYVAESSFTGPANTDTGIQSDVTFHGLALNGVDEIVRVMNTDDCFRLFFLNTTNQTQMSAFLDQAAENIIRPFPIGLSSEVGLFVANPAYGGSPYYAQTFKNTDYHGTVVWSWQLAMMAAGLGRQIGRCGSGDGIPEFCTDANLYSKVLSAYDHLWDLIEANRAQLSHEVWSWKYADAKFQVEQLGTLVSTESNIRQLWSLTFLAIHKETFPSTVACRRTLKL